MKKLKEYNYGDLIEINSFLISIKQHDFIDYDGFGYFVVDEDVLDEDRVYPSDILKNKKNIPKECKNILWFNR